MFKFLKMFLKEEDDPRVQLQENFVHFRRLLDSNNEALSLMADLEEKISPKSFTDTKYLFSLIEQLGEHVSRIVTELNQLSQDRYASLVPVFQRIREDLQQELEKTPVIPETPYILPLHALTREKTSAVGAKMANLGEIRNRLGLNVPRGFAITAGAYQAFMAETGLAESISRKLAETDTDNLEALQQVSQEVQELIFATPLPKDLEEILLLTAQALPSNRLAVRSSAVGEDSDYSFAGQFVTLLNATVEDLPNKYKQILASKFTPQAIRYWNRQQFAVSELPMAVGVLSMVPARTSGVMFTVDPHAPQLNTLMINALWGLGKYAVEGAVTPDLYVVAKQDGLQVVEEKIAHKPIALTVLPEGGYQEQTLAPEQADAACLSQEQIRQLAEIGLALEKHFGGPQDVEWAEDQEGAIVILQSRPLRLESLGAPAPAADTTASPLPAKILPLLEGGQRAVGGVAAGPVYWLHSDREIDKVPEGAVVALRHPSTRLVLVMDRLNAIITEIGSPTDHMTILAREFRVPTIVGAGPAILTLQNEQLVTLDADHSKVFPGIVVELLQHRYDKGETWQETMLFQKYRQIIKKVVPLHLLEPESLDFQADKCRTLHDITRFCHEKAMDAMFNPNVEEMVSAPGVARLQADLPFNLFIMDLGGGLAMAGQKVITEQDILSRPLQAMLRGFHHPNVRSGQVAPDLQGFISVFANTMYDQGKAEGGLGGKSFAIVSDSYLNFSSRLGYHFGLVDAYVAPDINDNYLSFQFKGGAAGIDRRERRARMLQVILEDMGFKVTVKQDLVQGRLVKFSQEEIDTILESLAVLMAFCRQLDMAFTSDAVMETYLEAFRNGNYDFGSIRTMQ
jgi:pyruvate,water dikinase